MDTDVEPGSRLEGSQTGRRTYLRRTAAVFGLGLLGVAGVGVSLALAPEGLPTVPDVPRSVLLVASLVQPAVLVLVAAAVGARLAPGLGFRSHVVARVEGESLRRPLRRAARTAVPVGLAVGGLIVVLDAGLSLLAGAESSLTATEATTVATVLASIPARFLYGGIAEEVLPRWGFMTLLVWVGWRLTGRPTRPSAPVVWAAIVGAAVVFGAAHLPAAAAETSLTPSAVARIVALNAVGGVAFGWVYWRYSLEAAMLAHASAHVALLVPALTTVL
ncbi:CPBP family glutamic-type intramembrane protease [Halomarina ordinaria]|uniref:Type II CAAX prenyl endopeptidase Rce1 family protein n=1 Tax=Halomarina ordinaria TaxID=3033939 RepID=A0ABD5U3M1_9EURY|nr:CPBP family glutamic-type intramembrane protease [Halomarina sp. PSRA2]